MLQRPIDAPIRQYFGENPADYLPYGLFGHEGLDFGAPVGTPVVAAHDGQIVRKDSTVYGMRVDVVGARFVSAYGHLSKVIASGDVKKGQLIALSGNTGRSSAPHLHWHIFDCLYYFVDNGYNGLIDPLPFIEAPSVYPHVNDVYDGMLDYLLPFPGVKVIIKNLWVKEVKQRYPNKRIIGRWHFTFEAQQRLLSMPTQQAADEMERRICNDPAFQYCDWIEGLNEIGGYPYRPNPGHEPILAHMLLESAFSKRVRARGKKYLGGGWSTGNPDMQWYRDPEYARIIREDYDGFNLHEYYAPLMQSPGNKGNVFRHYEVMARFPDKPIHITECGGDSLAPNPHLTPEHRGYFGMGVTPRQAAEDIAWYQERARAYSLAPYCLGVSDPTWDTFNWWKYGKNELASLVSDEGEQPVDTTSDFVNGDFEGGFRNVGGVPELYVAIGWEPFYASPPARWYGDKIEHYDFRPEYKRCGDETNGPKRSINGFGQQWFNSHAGHRAGIYQQFGVIAGQKITATASMMSWHTQVPHKPEISMDEDWIPQSQYEKRIGIDPTGGTDAFSERVVWSEPIFTNDEWVSVQVTAVAEEDTATVFLFGAPMFAYQANNCYVDAVSVQVGEPSLEEIEELIIAAVQNHIIPLNPDAALERAAAIAGLLPASDEVRDVEGYVAQAFRKAGQEDLQEIAYCKDGEWDKITWVTVSND